MSATTGSDTRSGIGARLRAGRERMGMTLLQVAEKLHVDAKVPESLETEHFDALGAPVYVKGHLRHYAELIGEHPAELLDLYGAATKPTLPDLTHIAKAARTSDPRKLVVPSLVVLIAFALVGTVWWVLQALEGKGMFGTPATPRVVSDTVEPPETATAADTLPSEGAVGPPGAAGVVPVSGVSNRLSNGATTRPEAGLPKGAAEPHPASAAAATAPAAVAESAVASADAARPRTIDVTLKFAADSWVEVYDANGQRLFYDIGSADSARKLTGMPPLRVVLGNAPGVTLNVNGKPAPVPADAVRDDTAQFVINRSGRIVRARSQADGG